MLLITHIQHQGPRAVPIINQGLLALNASVAVDSPYISLGTEVIKKCANIRSAANESTLIFVGRRGTHEDWLTKDNLWDRVVWYDFEDHCAYDPEIVKKARLYVKRSVVDRDRAYINLKVGHKPILPIDYCILDEYIGYHAKRVYSVACLFGSRNRLGDRRNNIKDALVKADFKESFIGSTCDSSEYGSLARNSIKFEATNNCFIDYLKVLGSSRVVATAYPQNHDGDCRTWEALASGGLVVLDTSYIKHNHPLIDGKHVVRYDASDHADIKRVIDQIRELLKNEQTRAKIAKDGYQFAMKHHRPVNRLQQIINAIDEPFFI